jgi:hypothetical protein
MNSPQYIPSFYFYKFAQGVSEPYTALQAYRGGAIDQYGNILKAESSIDPLEYLIIKLKKIFDELPPGLTKAKLNNYMSTMQLFGEEVKQIGITDSEYIGLVESYIALHIDPSVSYMELCEDMAAGGMGTPGTSTGYNTGSVSGYDPAMGTTKTTAPILKGLDNCEMFDVCPEEMGHFKSAKAWKHVPDTETKNYLQRYQRRNPKAHMAVRSVDPDTGESDLYWINFKPLSFMEEYDLEKLDILNEEYHTGTEGHHIGHAISSLLDIIDDNEEKRKSGSASKNINAYATEYNGRGQLMLQGFKDASMHGGDHAQKWIDLSMSVAGKPASQKDTDPDKAPDAWHYDATVKDSDFAKKVRKVDIGTDRKFGEIYVGKEVKDSALEKVLGIGRKILDKDVFKKAVREKSQSAETRKTLAPQMAQSSPWMILHRQDTSNRTIHTGDRFVMHEPEQLNPFLTSLQYNWSPSWGGKKQRNDNGEIEARPAIQSTDLRLRTTQHPNKPELGEFGAGYDILRTNKNSEEPKEAYTVETESIDHAMDHIPDGYKDQKGRSKQDIHAALMKMYSTSPHVQKGKTEGAPAKFTERGQLPLIIPPK